ncbi:hypothetical protein BD626DRAFT_59601 [Schizophyllum amplum]|uniref:Uncharacterized protein n=1 Tax=Schizophyllum amplum TaxID=97359 RepID=A0A550CBX6_9AGAR|nr:hypothetical protein BD626DRAFT_59601 [Auriculariopsis ampla]
MAWFWFPTLPTQALTNFVFYSRPSPGCCSAIFCYLVAATHPTVAWPLQRPSPSPDHATPTSDVTPTCPFVLLVLGRVVRPPSSIRNILIQIGRPGLTCTYICATYYLQLITKGHNNNTLETHELRRPEARGRKLQLQLQLDKTSIVGREN